MQKWLRGTEMPSVTSECGVIARSSAGLPRIDKCAPPGEMAGLSAYATWAAWMAGHAEVPVGPVRNQVNLCRGRDSNPKETDPREDV